jgi:hypothetical protein
MEKAACRKSEGASSSDHSSNFIGPVSYFTCIHLVVVKKVRAMCMPGLHVGLESGLQLLKNGTEVMCTCDHNCKH